MKSKVPTPFMNKTIPELMPKRRGTKTEAPNMANTCWMESCLLYTSISDEPYREIVFQGFSVPWLPHYYENTLVCYSYSKSLSIPGERMGYVLIPPTVADHDLVYAAVCGACLLYTSRCV